MNAKQLVKYINDGGIDEILVSLYGEELVPSQRKRYISAVNGLVDTYAPSEEKDVFLFSVPGRSELSGNHTDHNHGKVIAGSISLDIIAAAVSSDDTTVRVKSEGFDGITVDYSEYREPREGLYATSDALVSGMCCGFLKDGYNAGGFDAYTTSSVLKGSGLSSSAAFEVMIGNILNHLYNGGKVDNVEIAKLAQYAENLFFGKPCGLMDQMACAVGGIISIDFKDPKNPVIEKLDFDITEAGYNLCIVNTGGNHADLGEDYASVPTEMKQVAAYFGKSCMREVSEEELLSSIPVLRDKVGDRAVLRALHFIRENERVDAQKAALKTCDLDGYFKNVIASGRSSFCYLQNVYTTKNLTEQGLSLALCLTENYLGDKRAAYRVHGGGFAGTIQAYAPCDCAAGYRSLMDSVFGDGACMILNVRPLGAIKVL